MGQADAILILDYTKRCAVLINAADTRYPSSAANLKTCFTQQLPPGSDVALVIA